MQLSDQPVDWWRLSRRELTFNGPVGTESRRMALGIQLPFERQLWLDLHISYESMCYRYIHREWNCG